jgi:amino acid transporter
VAIVSLIVVFIALFPEEGGVTPINLGLTVLTGFATFNLLLPLAIVNGALIYHRRAFPDIERGFRVPGVPVVPVLGIIANIGLISNLPRSGVVTGIGLTMALVGVYVVWGGRREIDELVQQVRPRSPRPEGRRNKERAPDRTRSTTGFWSR